MAGFLFLLFLLLIHCYDAQLAANDTFFDAFRTLDEFNDFLTSLAKQYPDIVTKIVRALRWPVALRDHC
jgi:hypothetical protein